MRFSEFPLLRPSWERIPLEAFVFFGGNPMNTQEYKRRLRAILSADLASYSHLTANDRATFLRTPHIR
ncbi:MAG: hypothetical protein ACMUIU_06265 [bacterium]